MNVAHMARVLAAERCSVHEIALALGRREEFIAKSIRFTPKPDRHRTRRSSAERRERAKLRAALRKELLDLLNCASVVPESIGKVPTFSRLDGVIMQS